MTTTNHKNPCHTSHSDVQTYSTRSSTFRRSTLGMTLIAVLSAPLVTQATVSISAEYQETIDGVLYLRQAPANNAYNLISVKGESWSLNGLVAEQSILATHGQFSITASSGGKIEINGDTRLTISANGVDTSYDKGTHGFYSEGSSINLNGNVDAILTHDLSDDETQSVAVGANMLYANKESQITVGTESSTSKLWVLAAQPDLLSAKNGSTVEFKSTRNQLIGTIDMMDDANSEGSGWAAANCVSIRLSGSDSYWFGDEKTTMNAKSDDGRLGADLGTGDKFEITLDNGAQWSYFGLDLSRDMGGKHYQVIRKRISKITLNGGIINLYDENIRQRWQEIGLWDRLKDGNYGMNEEERHDYVRIGDLQGSGGIFRLDLNANDKMQSDMIFIEKGSGTHYFEPYNLTLLESITPENTLTFALTAKDANSVKFADKMNLDGETLYDYELEINSKTIAAEDIAKTENTYWDKTKDLDKDDVSKFSPSEFVGGTNWFIQRITMHESSAARAMTGAGFASYDAAIEMDRRDRREAQLVRDATNPDNGLWVRVSGGRSAIENQYRWDRRGVSIGFDREILDGNRFGAWLRYDKGETDLLDVNGKGDMSRTELAIYDTITFGSQYVDLVGRVGRVENEFDVTNKAYATHGDYDQDYAALSAEYGIRVALPADFFVEPQAQVQAAFLKSYDYDSDRGMKVEADGTTSILGRLGLRAGRILQSDTATGEVYARADVLHQFTDGQDATMRDDAGHSIDVVYGDNDTYGILGLGAAVYWADRYGLQFDVERSIGGDTDDAWQIAGHFRYAF